MSPSFMLERFSEFGSKEALVWREKKFLYQDLLNEIETWQKVLLDRGLQGGEIVLVEADFSPKSIALILTLVELQCIALPVTSDLGGKIEDYARISQAEIRICIDQSDHFNFQRREARADHPLILELRKRRHSGLILFSSGSTGESKAVLHDFPVLLEKFKVRRSPKRTLSFLLFDHIGGVNTILSVLSNGGCVIVAADRSPTGVARAIENHQVQVLPTSPSFLKFLLLSGANQHYDLSSLELITYGTEPMSAVTLQEVAEAFPKVKLQQTYGLSELGILRSKSESSRSLWVKVGGESYETRIVNQMLEIKAKSAMLGYLNADSPFTPDGWFKTGDVVETKGEWIRILGRQSEIINVGGEKVYPAEIESVLQNMEGVEDIVVFGESNPFLGNIVVAKVQLTDPSLSSNFRLNMNNFCRDKLDRFKIPQKIVFTEDPLYSKRFKKIRKQEI